MNPDPPSRPSNRRRAATNGRSTAERRPAAPKDRGSERERALAEQLEARERELAQLGARYEHSERLAATLLAELAAIKASAGWSLLQRLLRVRRRLAPPASRRERLLRHLIGRAPAPPARVEAPPGDPDGRLRDLRRVVGPGLSVLVPVGDSPAWLEATVASLLGQEYPNLEVLLCGPVGSTERPDLTRLASGKGARVKLVEHTGSAAEALNVALGQASGAYVAVCAAGDRLVPGALARLGESLGGPNPPDVLYSDEALAGATGAAGDSVLKPDWSPELALAYPYTGRCCLIRRELAVRLGGWSDATLAAEEYDLVLRASEQGARIAHLAAVLHLRAERTQGEVLPYGTPAAVVARRAALRRHLAARGLAADVVDQAGPAGPRVRPRIADRPLVSVIIPTRDRVELLQQCIASIETRTDYSEYEIVIVDNDSSDPATLRYLAGSRHRVVPAPGPFNFSAVNNLGARAARGEQLLFLNNDTEVIAPEWLQALLEWSQLPDIGCVGAKLLFGHGHLQHVGVTLHGGVAHHPFYNQAEGCGNYWLETDLVRNFSAVTAGCLMVKRAIYDEVGGLDEALPLNYNDVDFCLKVRRRGYRNLFTPYAVLYHHESASRGPGRVLESEMLRLQRRHGRLLWADPFWPRGGRQPDELLAASGADRVPALAGGVSPA